MVRRENFRVTKKETQQQLKRADADYNRYQLSATISQTSMKDINERTVD